MVNEGFLSILKIFETMEVSLNPDALAYAKLYNKSRISTAENSTAMTWKEARKSRWAEKVAKNEAYEGILYAPGMDD